MKRRQRIIGNVCEVAIGLILLLTWAGPVRCVGAHLPNPNQGPGGPILVITSASSTYGTYYAEILRTEGLNEFAVVDIGTVTGDTLNAYDVVILAPTALTAVQVGMFSDWVNAGGNLIAMRPDAQLASLLGLTSAGSTLSNAYLLVNTSMAPGSGIVGQSIQFHGTADGYALNGASSVATLYTNPTTATSNPAVTLRSVGTSGGHAATFTYDLATSVVYTRQGNPAWAAQERDGVTPIRPDDKFYGAAIGDPQPDWVDLDNEVSIPQADEQQRLLANLILQMNLVKKPLPRFWYFPNGKKAVVIMTGDDHGNGGTAGRFDQFIAASPAGCNVANWECIRSTSYIYVEPDNLTDAQAASYTAQGFEVGLHINTDCADFTPASLDTIYSQQVSGFTSSYSSIPAPITQRHHCIAWSDWITGAKTELKYGMRLDTSYYFWPPNWLQDRPGHFTGSAVPMRFADLDGTIIDVYNVPTQMTDESGQSYPFTSDALLSAAVGSQGYYGVYTVNAHNDSVSNPVSDAVVSSALARGVPIVSSVQMLNWLDSRNSSSFGGLTWNGNALSFTITPGSGANGLQAMVPTHSSAGLLTSIAGLSGPVPFTVDTIKGVEYAFFSAAAGNYTASYAADTTPPTVTSTSPVNGATGVSQGATVNATFSEAMDPTTINSATFVLRDSGNTVVPAAIAYTASTHTAVLTPTSSLAASTTYTATLTTGLKDLSGNALAANYTWSFTTAAGPSCPCGAWSSSTTPGNPSVNDPNAVELGVKFKVDVNGFITGVRFYKGTTNTGTHIGNLWSSAGQLLATATFSNETASGWQQVSFPTPVPVTANTVYVASYYTSVGNYAADNGFFASSGVDNYPVHLLQDGVSGGNGVYAYGSSSSFPSSTYQSSNYWVDVVFTVNTGPIPLSVTGTTPASGATAVSQLATVSGTFSNALSATTINASTFILKDASNTQVSGSYTVSSNTATFTPSSALAASATYTATLTTAVQDVNGNALAAAYVWSFTTSTTITTVPEPAGWYAGDMHVHRSCGGSAEALSSMYDRMNPQNLAAISLLADMGNGEVQDPVTDLPLVNGQDDPISTPGRIVHWDTEWHWDATYTQYPHQALGGHIVALGLSNAHQIWDESTFPILDWAHQQNGIAGFAHLQYLDGSFPQSLTCCTPIEYPVEVALGAADFISEDVDDSGAGFAMYPESFIQAYYKLLNSGFRPGFAAGTDYPCNTGRPLGSLLTYVQVAGGQMTYRNWIQGIKNGRTVVSRNGHNEFLNLTVNGSATPGDEIQLPSGATLPVTVQWTATENLSGTIELVSNGAVVGSLQASVAPGSPVNFNTTVDFPKSGWVVARRMGSDGHQVHTAAVFVIVNNVPIRASAADAQYYVQWMDNLLTNTSPGGIWNSFFPTSLTAAQARYQAAKAVFQQIATEAAGPACTSNCTIWPSAVAPGIADSGPDSGVELGVKFKADVDGTITGIRFYKASTNTGTHIGNLWSSTGQLLASATFSGETASGWQQVTFAPPVSTTANTVYVASYYTSVGHYSDDQNYFASTEVDNPPLHALPDGVSGFNGVYAYGSVSSFPAQGYNSSNYWVDVVFNPATAATLNSIAVTPANPTIQAGATQQFTATGTYSDNSTKDITSQATWASSNTAVATISPAGLASGVSAGATTISATQNGITGNTMLTVQGAPLAITTTSLPNGSVGVTYSATLTASGGTPPYTWSISSGSLPAGLTLNPTGGIAGTPTVPGTSTFTVQAKDAATLAATASQSLSISIAVPVTNTGFLAPNANAPVTSGAGDNNGFQTTPTNAYASDGLFAVDTNSGTNTSTSCTNTGKDKHDFYNYSLSLPSGANIQGIEVRLDAKVSSASSAPMMCVQLSWDSGTTWTTAQSTATLSTATATYVLGGAANTWGRSWTVGDLAKANFRLRIIDVASSTARTFSLDWVAVRVTYQGSGPALSSVAVTPTNPTIKAGATQQFTATGTYSDNSTKDITSQAAWTSSNTAAATISSAGLATGVGGGTTTISATQDGITGSTTLTVQPPLAIATTSLPGGTVGTAYSATLTASGGTPPYTWSITVGALPAGLTLNPTTGSITGTPTANGTFNLTAQVTDSAIPPAIVTKSLSIGIATNTGFLLPSSNAPVTSGAGDNNGFQTTPTNAYATDGLFAVDTNSGTNTSTSCTNTGKDKHDFYNHTVSLPNGTTIQGIEVRLDAKVSSASSAPKMCVQLSWNGGATWTAAQSTATLSTTTASYILGGAANTWGRSWAAGELSNANLRLRIIDVASSTARTFSLDGIAVRVTYQ